MALPLRGRKSNEREAAHRKTEKEQENTEGRTSIPPAHHTFIIVFAVSRESIGKKRKTDQHQFYQRSSLSPESVITGRMQNLQRHPLRPFQRQVSFHAFSSLCILIIYLLCMPFMFTVQVNYNSLEQ